MVKKAAIDVGGKLVFRDTGEYTDKGTPIYMVFGKVAIPEGNVEGEYIYDVLGTSNGPLRIQVLRDSGEYTQREIGDCTASQALSADIWTTPKI